MTSMRKDFENDARLTAFVLGELEPDAAEALEDQMDGDASLRDEVQAIRATISAVKAEFDAESVPGMTVEQRDAVHRGDAPSDQPPVIFTFRRVVGAAGLLAAACLALAVVAPMFQSGRKATEYAIDDSHEAEKLGQLPAGPGGRPAMRGGIEMREKDAGEAVIIGDTLSATIGLDALEEQQEGGRDYYLSLSDASRPSVDTQGGGSSGNQFGQPGDVNGRPVLTQPSPSPGPSTGPSAGGAPTRRPPPPRDAPVEIGMPWRASGRAGQSEAEATGGDRREVARKRRAPGPGAPELETTTADEEAAVRGNLGFYYDAPVIDLDHAPNREAYAPLVDNPFIIPKGEAALSTFSIDVDTASYSNTRRIVRDGNRLPPADAVRIEEMINYFKYDYEPPTGEHPFAVHTDVAACPWEPSHRLVRVGLKGKVIDPGERPATNLVFLLDVSGSMNQPNKLPLVKESMRLLVNNLTADDKIAMVVYAGAAGLVLDSTYCYEKEAIIGALDQLNAGGSTNGGQGIELAYKVAQEHFIEGGVNRVILCTDGDFNVGITSEGELDRFIEEKRASGVYLSVLGFGTGNWQDQRMESLSNKGNGNFAYIDSLKEAHKVLVQGLSGTLVTIAKDVKIQVEFNPAQVGAYRLIGYANRLMEAQDFRDKTKDAGEIGAGHTVTALYEVVPAGGEVELGLPEVDDLKYQRVQDELEPTGSSELLTVKLAYKGPEAKTDDESTYFEHPVTDDQTIAVLPGSDYQFAAAVAGYGMLLRQSPHKGNATWELVLDLAASGLSNDPDGHRAEFVQLVERTRELYQHLHPEPEAPTTPTAPTKPAAASEDNTDATKE